MSRSHYLMEMFSKDSCFIVMSSLRGMDGDSLAIFILPDLM